MNLGSDTAVNRRMSSWGQGFRAQLRGRVRLPSAFSRPGRMTRRRNDAVRSFRGSEIILRDRRLSRGKAIVGRLADLRPPMEIRHSLSAVAASPGSESSFSGVRQTLNSLGLLIVVSNLKAAGLLYILTELAFSRCLIRRPSSNNRASLWISPVKLARGSPSAQAFRFRNRITSAGPCLQKAVNGQTSAQGERIGRVAEQNVAIHTSQPSSSSPEYAGQLAKIVSCAGMDLSGEVSQHRRPGDFELGVEQAARPPLGREPNGYGCRVDGSGFPPSSGRANQSRPFRQTCMVKREQGLQPHVLQESELGMLRVMIQVCALSPAAFNGNLLGLPIATNPQCGAGLNAPQNANQPLCDLVTSGDFQGDVLFADLRAVQEFDLAFSLAYRNDSSINCCVTCWVCSLKSAMHVGGEQITVRAPQVDNAPQDATEQPVKSGQDSQDTLSELPYHILHGVAPQAGTSRIETPATPLGQRLHINDPFDALPASRRPRLGAKPPATTIPTSFACGEAADRRRVAAAERVWLRPSALVNRNPNGMRASSARAGFDRHRLRGHKTKTTRSRRRISAVDSHG